jgi:hypothetical protein
MLFIGPLKPNTDRGITIEPLQRRILLLSVFVESFTNVNRKSLSFVLVLCDCFSGSLLVLIMLPKRFLLENISTFDFSLQGEKIVKINTI